MWHDMGPMWVIKQGLHSFYVAIVVVLLLAGMALELKHVIETNLIRLSCAA